MSHYIALSWSPKTKARPRFGGNVYTDPKTRAAEAALAAQWPELWTPIEGPISVTTKFTDKKVHLWVTECEAPTTPGKRGDLDNYQKLIWDAMNGLAWVDDKQIVRTEAQWR